MSQEKETKLLTHVESPDNASGDDIQSSQFTSSVSEDMTIHELKNLMERPTLIRTAEILPNKSSCVFNYNLNDYFSYKENITSLPGLIDYINYPQDIVTKNPVVAAKIAQFTYFKADMKLEIKINKSPEILGCLMAVYFPTVENLQVDVSNLTLQGLTSYPYQILDFSTDTSLTMTVPYINQFDYFNFEQGRGSSNAAANFGTIALFNLQAPVAGTSNPKVSYSLFGSFENMELKLPVLSEGSGFRSSQFMAQSGIIERIPGSDIMSDDHKESKLSLNYNTIQIDNSKSLYNTNETSLKHVLARENIIGKLLYTAGQNSNTNSYIGKVRCFPKRPPKKSLLNGSASGTDVGNFASLLPKPIQMGTFDYVSNLFGRYTGTVEIGIRLLKTKFHYGRIAIVFDPFDTCGQELGSLLSTNYSMIIDLNAEDGMEGSSNYYRIPVPYMNNAGHSSIGNDFGITSDTLIKTAMVNENYGINSQVAGMREVYNPHLKFFALTELGYLETAASFVPILVSIRAGEDYELSIPTVNVAKADPAYVADDKFYCQSGLLELVPETMNKSKSNLTTSVGEQITDLMQLAKRYTPINVEVYKKPAFFEFDNCNFDNPTLTAGTERGPKYLQRRVVPGGVSLSLSRNTIDGHRLSNVEAVGLLYQYLYGGRNYKCTAAERGSSMLARLIHAPLFSGDIKSYVGASSEPNRLDNLEEFTTGPMISDPRMSPDRTNSGLDYIKGYAISPVTGVARALNGQMVVNTSINNYLEISRNFYSNRKLVSTDMVAGRKEAFSDEIITQIVSFSPTRDRTLEFSQEAMYANIGPHVKRTSNTYGANDWRKVDYRDPSNTDSWGRLTYAPDDPRGCRSRVIMSPPEFETDDAMYFIGNSTRWKYGNGGPSEEETTASLTVAAINNSSVLEAMPSSGGYTFLRGPPCVVFL